MSLILSGTDGLSDVDGTAATPAIRGTDANTGIFFPAADTIAFSEGGVEAARINSSGQLDLVNNPILTGGTANGVAFLNGSKVLTSGSALTFDGTTLATTGKFGITGNGSVPTSSALEIGTNGAGSRLLYNVPTSGEHNFTVNGSVISFQTASVHGWNISGSEQMRLTSTGLGIGTSAPTDRLDIRFATGTGNIKAGVVGGNNVKLYNTTGDISLLSSDASSDVFLDSQRSIILKTATTERARITSSGNLGIGTTSPINNAGYGGFSLNGTSGALFSMMTNGTETTRIVGIGNETSIQCAASTGFISFVQGVSGGTERARIDASGNLLVGTTSGTEKFCVTSSANASTAFFLNNNGTAANQYGIVVKLNNDPNNTNHMVQCLGGATERATIRANGGLANYSANNVNLSDERTKTDITIAGNYLAKICAIPVRTFKYKDQTDDLLNLGVIAQEVEAIAPELVDTTGFGETPEDGIPLKAIYQTDLQYALMKCIQEQQALITQLTARLDAANL